MTHTTTSTSSTQPQSPVEIPEQEYSTLAELVSWYSQCTDAELAVIHTDHTESGLPLAEYGALLAEFGSYVEYHGRDEDTGLESQAEQGTVLETKTQAVAKTAAQLEQEQEQAEKAADQVLKHAAKVYRRGEKQYAWHLLRTGQLAHEYAVARMTIAVQYTNGTAKAARSTALDCVALELQKCSSGKVDVARMVQAYHAFVQLAGQPLPTKPLAEEPMAPYGHYRDCWANLVQRVKATENTPAEQWEVLPGMAERCREAYHGNLGSSRDEVAEVVNGISGDWTAEQAREKAEQAQAAAQAERDAKAKAEQQRAALAEQAKATAAAEAAAKAEQDDAKRAELTAQAVAAKAELVEQQHADQVASAKAEQAARDKAKADQDAKAAQERDQKAQDRAAGKTARKPKTNTTVPSSVQQVRPVKEQATDATPEQWADMLDETLAEHPQSEDALFALLAKHLARGTLSKRGVAAVEAALVIHHRKPAQTPVTSAPLKQAS